MLNAVGDVLPAPLAVGSVQADSERVINLSVVDPICMAVARQKLPLFHRLPAIDVEDLYQHARLRALDAVETYRPPYSFPSWIWRAAAASVLDLYKSAARERGRVSAIVHSYPGTSLQPELIPATPAAEKVERRARAYAVEIAGRYESQTAAACEIDGVPEMKIKIPRKLSAYPSGRLGHPPTAYAAALAYRYTSGIGWRTLANKLQADAKFLRLCGFRTPPVVSSLQDAARRLRRWGQTAGIAASN